MDDIARERSYPTPVAHSPWLPLLLISLASQRHSPRTKTYVRPKYDYIVVGAGSAGSVVASRLSEIPCVTVLLLEAGQTPPRLTDVPAYSSSFFGSDVDWAYQTVTQKYSAGGFPGMKQTLHMGKMLGGSSSLNSNMFVRGNHRNYDDWAAAGARGWNYTEVLPYFKKMEDCRIPNYCGNGYHGRGGPVTNSLMNYRPEIKRLVFEAHRSFGIPTIDMNGPTQTGLYDQQTSTRNGQKCSTAKAYLVPKEKEDNLDIVINAFVKKVVINRQRVATGVLVDIKGKTEYIEAGREVIVSAGATNTPKLLMLSGIGPADHLEDHGIPVVADLPVGFNLQDHPVFTMPYELSSNIKSIQEKKEDVKTLQEYIWNRSGPLTSPMEVVAFSFEKDKYSNPAVDFPPNQMLVFEFSAKDYENAVTPEIYKQVYAPYVNKTMVSCGCLMLHPKTRGSIKLRSTNPYDRPIIDIQYLEHPVDMDHMVEGLKFCNRVFSSEPLRKAGAKPVSTLFPGCEGVASSPDLYLRCVAKLMTGPGLHLCGTAKMGDPRDPTVVLDPKLRVKTIHGLRVVDGSVMPTVTSGNTNVPIIMIGEKASDLIKETVRCPSQPQPTKVRAQADASAFAEIV